MKKTLEKTFPRDGVEYTVSLCTAIASCDKDSGCCQKALLVENTTAGGEKIQKVVFGYEMPETDEAFDAMCEDSSAWESDAEVLDIGHFLTARETVQAGLDGRAEARAEADQAAQDYLFLEGLNKIAAANQETAELIQAAQQRVRAQRREKRQEEAEATRRDTFLNRIFAAVAIIAAVIWLYTIEAVVFWLAMTIGIAGLLYIIVNTVGYYTRDKRKEN